MFLSDKLTLGTPRRTKEGYLAVRARAARAGVYDYMGCEVDPAGEHFAADQVVKVYRPEAEVFATDSVHSFLLKPITDDHPVKPVTATNWTDVAKGVNAGALRDGEFLAFDLVLMDAALIEAVDKGKRELSNGYSSEIAVEDGKAPDGTEYQAVMRHIRGNHIAVVAKGRAGPECRIGDAATCDSIPVDLLERLLGDGQTYTGNRSHDKNAHQRRETVDNGVGQMATEQMIFDGMPIEVTDQGKAAILKLQGQLATLTDAKGKVDADVVKLTADVETLTATVATKDGEITGLNKKLEDAAIKPEVLEQMAADRSALIAQAKGIAPSIVTDGKTEAEIRQAAVAAQLGDAAVADMDENHVLGAFRALTKDAKVDPVRKALVDGVKPNTNGAAELEASRRQWLDRKETAYRGPVEA